MQSVPHAPTILTRRDPEANARLRALMVEQPEVAFDIRQDAREDQRVAKLATEGFTHSQCSQCGRTRVLSWMGGFCNEFDSATDDQMCGGTYKPVKVMKASNPITGAVGLPVRVGGDAA